MSHPPFDGFAGDCERATDEAKVADVPFGFGSFRVSIRVEEQEPGPAPGERRWVNAHLGKVLDVIAPNDGASLVYFLDALARVSLKPDGTYELKPTHLPNAETEKHGTCNDAPTGALGIWCDLKPGHDDDHHDDTSETSWDRQGRFV